MTTKDDTIAAMTAMAQSFNPNKAKGVNAVIQLNILGEAGGHYVIKVADQKMEYAEGQAADANTSIDVKAEDWLRIMTGRMDPAVAFMAGKLKISGDLGLMMRFQQMFAM